MAAARRWIEPMTGDYVVEGGQFREDDGHASQIVLRLRLQRGSSAAKPTLGSRLHTLRKATRGASVAARSYVWEAIDDLIVARVIRDVTVSVTVGEAGNAAVLLIEVGYSDSAADGRTVMFTYTPGS